MPVIFLGSKAIQAKVQHQRIINGVLHATVACKKYSGDVLQVNGQWHGQPAAADRQEKPKRQLYRCSFLDEHGKEDYYDYYLLDEEEGHKFFKEYIPSATLLHFRVV